MQVKDIMTLNPRTCQPATNLAAVVKLMWDGDCGTVAVTDSSGKIVGMITDRDVCIALATKNQPASQLRAEDVISGKVFACKTDDDVRSAFTTMKDQRVRRLPVVDDLGKLQGVLSMNDVVLATARKPQEIAADDVLSTFRAICEHRPARAASAA